MKHLLASILACLMSVSACMRTPPPSPLKAAPHYVLGDAYQAEGHWYYPAEDFGLDATGIANVLQGGPRLTADGEIFDGGALVAAMPTVQLPAIAVVTNLENGRRISVRVNDRGPTDPGRIIALSPRAAALLLLAPGGAARVHVQLDTKLSHRVVEQMSSAPRVAIATAAPSFVTVETLPPPGAAPGTRGPATPYGAQAAAQAAPAVPDRMPETVYATRPEPGQLWLRAGTFGRFEYANVLAARLGGLGGAVLRSREGRQETYAVRAGPFPTIAAADAALRRAFGAGVVDARITVESD